MITSGIEMLEEILQRIGMIESRLDIMDRNIKTVVNSARLADMINKAAGTSLDDWSKAIKPGISNVIPSVKEQDDVINEKTTGFKNFDFEVSDASKLSGPPVPHRGARQLTKIQSVLVEGKLKIEKGDKVVPLSGVSVKIYDIQDKLIKSTKTNRAGHWMSHLPPGQYVAFFDGEVSGKKLLSQNKNFEVPEKLPEGQTKLEVI